MLFLAKEPSTHWAAAPLCFVLIDKGCNIKAVTALNGFKTTHSARVSRASKDECIFLSVAFANSKLSLANNWLSHPLLCLR